MKTIIKVAAISVGILLLLLAGLFVYSRDWKHAVGIQPLWRVGTSEKLIYLTFDDGPSREVTPALLDLLAQLDVRATFFVLGENLQENMDIGKRIVAEGHLIGNHSFDHPRLYFNTFSFIENQVLLTNEIITRTGQSEVRYLRPPYCGKFLFLPLILALRGMTLVTGTYDPPAEYIRPLDAEAISDQVTSHAEPGAIIFLHDGSQNADPAYLEAVRRIIVQLKARGYAFRRLDET